MAEHVFSRMAGVVLTTNLASIGFPSEHAGKPGKRGVAMRDEVDRLVAAWKSERPDLDFSPLEVLSRITRIARHLDIARRNAFADLDTWSFDVLAALRRAGAPYQLSPGQLMQETMVTSGTMTNRLDRLEELNLITRQPDPEDGRGSLVTLTKSGMRAVDTAMEELLKRESEILKNMTKAEQAKLAASLSEIEAPFDEQ
ncbi:MAG: MarR family transcriptional regulator [Candidatus Nanopelagicaceae bacterium]|nr:MarR family transcriptional regulator [Candidatus Nanopelagicaceae bacterium]